MSNGTTTPATPYDISLIPQTGMPPIVVSKSREVAYDAMQTDALFILNPFGPQKLYLSRPNHHW